MVTRLTPRKASSTLRSDTIIQAGWESTSILILVDLAYCPCAKTRRRVAENPRTPITILARLAADEDTDVRIAVSENKVVPAGLLNILAKDEDADVRFALAENCLMPLSILNQLAHDTNPYVSCRASQTLEQKRLHESPRAA